MITKPKRWKRRGKAQNIHHLTIRKKRNYFIVGIGIDSYKVIIKIWLSNIFNFISNKKNPTQNIYNVQITRGEISEKSIRKKRKIFKQK